MNCESVADNLTGIVDGSLGSAELARYRRHIAGCASCREAVLGAEALAMLKDRETGEVPDGLFDHLLAGVDRDAVDGREDRRFWLGTAFGGAIAASLFAVVMIVGWLEPARIGVPDVPEFLVAVSEPRRMDIAIEADRPLQNARISVFLSGGVELEGYGRKRELSWTTDLKAGVNRLSLPVLALNEDGGQVLVRLSHPQTEQLFVVKLKTRV